MDNLTHTLVGLMIARASTRDESLYRSTHAAGMTMIAANIPDIDVVSMFGGTLSYLEWHRSYTHSFAFLPLMAIIPPLIIRAVFRTPITLRMYALSCIGVLSHLLLDWTNAYGIRLFLPFSSRWLRLDITDVVDPWIWLMLLIAVIAPALVGLVNSEIRSRPNSRSGFGAKHAWACLALGALLIYEGARYTAHNRALAVMGARMFNGSVARRLTAVPSRFNPLHWRGIAEGDGFVDIVPVDLAESFDPGAGEIDYESPPDPAINAAKETRAFQIFGKFSQLPFWKTTPVPEGTHVELIDLRFGSPQAPGFEASALVNASNQVIESHAGFGPLPVRGP